MTQYNATGEVAVIPTLKRGEAWLATLVGYHPAVGRSATNHAEITITVESVTVESATALALALLTKAAGELLSFTIMTTAEYDRRLDVDDKRSATDELGVGTARAAQMLGVTRQRIQQLHAEGVLPAKRYGNSLVYPVSVIERLAAEKTKEKA